MSSPKILVVDDDRHLVDLLRDNFEAEGYQVICGYDGQMAIALARKQKPNLIILDVNMPLTNGVRALEILRGSPETQNIPVLFLTGATSETFYPAVEATTRVAYLKKPLDLQHLNEMVRDFISRYGPQGD